MASLPLITHPSADSIIAWRDGEPVTAAQFLADVERLRGLLPAGGHMLNACGDRYRFMVGLCAALLSDKISLLPSTQTPEMIRQMLAYAPDVFCLTDAADCAIALPQVRFPEGGARPEPTAFAVPSISVEQIVAQVFTSGSTGTPIPHRKTWGALVRNVQAEAQLWGLNDGRRHAVIGTVPPQHMYGFESTVLVVMQSGSAMVAARSFYPADIVHALQAVPRPRTLVSTPVHLRALLAAGLDLPAADLVVSATAPLSVGLAVELEAAFDAPLLEIYGSTETGQIAVRHTARTQEWQLFPGVRFRQDGDMTIAHGGHVEQPTEMQDVIELVGEDRFLLHGRRADMLNIAGKRNSLAYLNLQLTAIPGVADGAFFMPDEHDIDGVTRLAAFVVAPGLTAAAVLRALRDRIDPVFLPRPLHFVDALPRNATGKLPREALHALLRSLVAQADESRS
ncbi:AMP-ligase [Noviherbaspirillum aridicola]|uniref:Long-chain-fatty-acid--CoA ligase n=1 Tax=Noviherbaspirillum aridicola TaxID=2849687 RepID=A0ABQ4Q680_9BURK|nr:AMP-binding protein [Noviherbaspirillum aridicola]GIZ52547.1 AMP-ligase [Noviherbaspirillum aridicola]